MAAPSPIPVSALWVPVFFKLEGPNGYYIQKAHKVYEYVVYFIHYNLLWLTETSGQKTFFIKLPEAFVNIAKHIGPASSIPGKMLHKLADIVMPLHALGGCARTYLAFVDAVTKFPVLFNPPEKKIDYVVVNADNRCYQAQFPLSGLEQFANKVQTIFEWSISASEWANHIWRVQNPSLPAENSPFSSVASYAGRYMYMKGLCTESWFLYQTWLKEKPLPYYVQVDGARLAKEECWGSALKISLHMVYLSFDLFQTFAPKENKPLWLDTAIFAARILPTFINPVAMRYWPNMVIKPLYTEALVGG